VSGLHPHRFRNTFTKRLLSQGVPIEDVAKFMGHRSIEVTQRHYNAWIDERELAARDRVRAAQQKMLAAHSGLTLVGS
jgi:integrase